MKIAIPINNKGALDNKVAPHFGRANYFLIYNTEKKTFNILLNPETSGGSELPPDFLHRQGVKAIIAFSLGPKAYNKFKNYNIKTYKAIEETIEKNIQKLENNELKELEKEDIF